MQIERTGGQLVFCRWYQPQQSAHPLADVISPPLIGLGAYDGLWRHVGVV